MITQNFFFRIADNRVSILTKALRKLVDRHAEKKQYMDADSILAKACYAVLSADSGKSLDDGLHLVTDLVAGGEPVISGLIPLRNNEGKLDNSAWEEREEAIANAIIDGLVQRQVRLLMGDIMNQISVEDSTDCLEHNAAVITYCIQHDVTTTTYDVAAITHVDLYGLFLWVCYHNCSEALQRLLSAFPIDEDYLYSYYYIVEPKAYCTHSINVTKLEVQEHQATALGLAEFYKYQSVMDILKQRDARAVLRSSSRDITARDYVIWLHDEIRLENIGVIRNLISLVNVNPNRFDTRSPYDEFRRSALPLPYGEYGRTALHLVALVGNKTILMWLLPYFSSFDYKDIRGDTALNIARQYAGLPLLSPPGIGKCLIARSINASLLGKGDYRNVFQILSSANNRRITLFLVIQFMTMHFLPLDLINLLADYSFDHQNTKLDNTDTLIPMSKRASP